MGKNPRTTKIEKTTLKEDSSDTETSENSNSNSNSTSNESNPPKNEPIDYEKQRKLRIAENNARMEAMGLHKIANSLMKLRGKRKKVDKNGKEDDEYQPSDEDDDGLKGDDSDSSSSEEVGKKKMKRRRKKEKVCATIQKVEPPPGVFIPDSSLRFSGHCGETVCLKFPKATKEEVKDLMSRYPKGFNGFNREQGERAFRRIADLKAGYFTLRRSCMWYPEFREDVVEGLPFPKGFTGFNLEQSKEISGVVLTLENCYHRLKKFFQPNMHGVVKGFQLPEAPGSHPMETSRPPHTHVSCPQQQASTYVPGPVHLNAPISPGYMQFPLHWGPSMVPFVNCPPPAGYYPGMP